MFILLILIIIHSGLLQCYEYCGASINKWTKNSKFLLHSDSHPSVSYIRYKATIVLAFYHFLAQSTFCFHEIKNMPSYFLIYRYNSTIRDSGACFQKSLF